MPLQPYSYSPTTSPKPQNLFQNSTLSLKQIQSIISNFSTTDNASTLSPTPVLQQEYLPREILHNLLKDEIQTSMENQARTTLSLQQALFTNENTTEELTSSDDKIIEF